MFIQLVAGLALTLGSLPLMFCGMTHRNPIAHHVVSWALILSGMWLILTALSGKSESPVAVSLAVFIGFILITCGRAIREYLSRH